MKKTYIIPSVKTFALRTHKMMATSLEIHDTTTKGSQLGNENNFDDQESTPWYK